MRLLSIVLLFSYCFIASANQSGADKADCNDQTVFEAADEVLRSLNYAKEDGNQFALYRITEAAKKEESGQVQVFLSFEMQESVCGVKNGIDWQRCAFKANEADFGECSAHVLVNTEPNSEEITNSEVIWKNCSTAKGWQPKTPKYRGFDAFGSVGRCQVLLENEVSFSIMLARGRKHEVLHNLLVDRCIEPGPTPADDMAPQINTDCGNVTLDFKHLCVVALDAPDLTPASVNSL